MKHIDTAISMPEHNEGEVLLDFIGNLESELNGISFIIVDDLSPQEFRDLIQKNTITKKIFICYLTKLIAVMVFPQLKD